ncbi:MAG: PIN domain-containing protein [Chloroflexi bacterium]|nr:PIN domain-containing protein [Chloroflexota bacterium]MCI0893952.1 PIN domain-containing protein [Chloroflexota bacterium]
MAFLIDSSVFIGLERRSRPVVDLRSTVGEEAVALAAITASELLAGVTRADTQERHLRRSAFVEAILDVVPVFAFDLSVARVHAEMTARLIESGQRIGTHDSLIAATAIAYGYSVLTDNLRDFGRIPGLIVRQPSW